MSNLHVSEEPEDIMTQSAVPPTIEKQGYLEICREKQGYLEIYIGRNRDI